MNKQNHHLLHKQLWTWLSDNPSKKKHHWPEWEKNGGNIPRINSYCFACDYTKNCYSCPITDNDAEACLDGLYDEFCNAEKQERSALALKIANLPWKDKNNE